MKDLEIAKDTVDLRAGRDCRARLPGRRSLRQRTRLYPWSSGGAGNYAAELMPGRTDQFDH